jgi:hypothetical protein
MGLKKQGTEQQENQSFHKPNLPFSQRTGTLKDLQYADLVLR